MTEEPTTRCGSVLHESTSVIFPNASCCYREAWNGHDQCIWHVDVDVEKPVEELREQRETETNRRLNRGALGNQPAEILESGHLKEIKLSNSLSFEACLLVDADLSGADLVGVNLSEADLVGADLSEAELINADLSGANLYHADLSGAELLNADLSGAKLSGVDFSGADMWDADLSKANLRDADLLEAELGDANLSGADLVGVDLSGAGMWKADLSGADLRFADLSGTNLQETCLSDVIVDQAVRCGRQDRAEQEAFAPQQWDQIAQAYHDLKLRFSEHGLVGKARRHHLLEREARGREARADQDYLAYAGSLASRYLTGYGVDYRRVVAVMTLVFGLSTAVFWAAGIEDSIYYSIVTFTTAPPRPPSAGWIVDAVAMFETVVGTVLVVLLGYVLGNRESF